jgi:hypothetical protein
MVASVSRVSVFVIVWTETGAPPPILTVPTVAERQLRLLYSLFAILIYQLKNVFECDDDHQKKQQREPGHVDVSLYVSRHRLAADKLDYQEENMPAVKRREGQKIKNAEVERYHGAEI